MSGEKKTPNVTYKTDTEGRVRQIEATLRNNPRGRDRLQQEQAKHFKNGVTTAPVDHGGHMIGSQFDGPVEQINYHSQHGPTNSSGTWYRMEMDDWATQPTNTVKVNIQPHFPSATSKRPDWFEVQYEYNNVQQRVSQLVPNILPVPTAPIGSSTFIIANP